MKAPHAILVIATLALTPPAHAGTAASWLESLHLSATATIGTVDNFSRTSDPGTSRDADTAEFGLASTHARQLAPSLLLVGTAELGTTRVRDFALNDQVRLGGRLSLQKKFGLGPQATVLQFSTAATHRDVRQSGDTGWTTEGRIELAKRVLPNLRLAASSTWLVHAAKRDVFDVSQQTWAADVEWDFLDRWTLAGHAARLEGDIVANASWPVWGTMLAGGFGETIFNYYTSRPWLATDLFGPGWVSYNIRADVDLWSVGLRYAATDATSLELRRAGAYVVNRVGITYPTATWAFGLSHRF